MIRKTIVTTILLGAGITALHGQPDRQPTRPLGVNTAASQAQPAPAQDALTIAKARPQVLQLRAALSRLPQNRVDIAALDRSNVPILISARPTMLTNLKVFAAADRYTASTKQNGVVIEINGTRLPVEAPRNFSMPRLTPIVPLNGVPAPAPSIPQRFHNLSMRALQPPAPVADALRDVSVQRTSYGVDISFTRFGSVYNITMDCGSETQDPEAIGPAEGGGQPPAGEACSEENALGLAKELEVAGGGKARQ